MVRPGINTVRELWLPFLLIQICGVGVVIGYFNVESFKVFCDQIAQVKSNWGLIFAATTMPVACGIVPELLKYALGIDRKLDAPRFKKIAFAMAVFSLGGMYVDTFYNWLNSALGDSREVFVVASKVAIDQFVYSPTIGAGWIVLAFTFREVGFNVRALMNRVGLRWYMTDVMPTLMLVWAYWIPMTSLMYTLPPGLTFIYGMAASAAISTLLTAMLTRNDRAA